MIANRKGGYGALPSPEVLFWIRKMEEKEEKEEEEVEEETEEKEPQTANPIRGGQIFNDIVHFK